MSVSSVVLRRLLQAVPTLFVVGSVVFIAMRLVPGDPARAVLGDSATPEQIEEFRAANGLDQPLWMQYLSWFGGVLVGNFGQSYYLRESVTALITQNALPTILNAGLALVILFAIGVPVGVFAATRAGGVVDRLVVGVAAVVGTIPSFLVGLVLIAVFAVGMGVLPSGGYALGADPGAMLSHMLLPAVVLALTQVGYVVRMTRAGMLDELSQSYVLSQNARGYSERQTTLRALRNAAVPLVTVAGQALGLMIAGAVIVEAVFTVPGLGQLTINAINRGDMELLAGVVMFISVIVIVINLVVDVAYALLDPRIRKGH